MEMINLYEELLAVTRSLAEAHVEYAVCGGWAMAVHLLPRHTVDLDLLVRPEAFAAAEAACAPLGYTFKARPMRFADGAVEIRRITKIDPMSHDALMLDFLLVTHDIEDVWATRQLFQTAEGSMWVVSREGLIKLKTFRSSGVDLEDIAALRKENP
jgi:hypothetical protein